MGGCTSIHRETIYRSSPKGAFISDRKMRHEKARKTNKIFENLVNEEFRRNINDVYDLKNGRSLGVGSFATVRSITHRNSGKEFALKTIETKGIKDVERLKDLITEIDIMKKLDHPSVARLQEVYHSNDYIFMVMDLYSGGDLVDRQRIKTEIDAAIVMKGIVDGIRYCHQRNIAHRDLKLENILYEHSGADARIKIVDFGLGIDRPEATLLRDVVGTWVYMSPELLKGRHNPFATDMWSIGVIAFTLIAGHFPFTADSLQMLQHRIQHKPVQMDIGNWLFASNECKDFVSRLLEKDPSRRMKAVEAQLHPWLTCKRSARTSMSFRPLAEDVTTSLKTFKDQSMLKRVALEVVARTLEPDQIGYLEEEFRAADKDGSGELSLQTFRQVMKESAFLRDKDIDLIFKSLDVEGQGFVNFTEFMAAGLKWQQLDERRLRLAFDRIDTDNTGYISLENLQCIFGSCYSIDEIKAAIEEFDLHKNGKIGFEDFCVGMRKSGADMSAFTAATMSGSMRTGISRIISHTTLQRLLIKIESDSEDEGHCNGSVATEDVVNSSLCSINDSYEKDNHSYFSEPMLRVSMSERYIRTDVSKLNDLTNKKSNTEKMNCEISIRRATSESGKDINRLLREMKNQPLKAKQRRMKSDLKNIKMHTKCKSFGPMKNPQMTNQKRSLVSCLNLGHGKSM